MEVRRLKAGETEVLKDLILRMYADAPTAFGETLADAQKRSDKEWQQITDWIAAGETAVGFIACDAKLSYGCVFGITESLEGHTLIPLPLDTVVLGRMWVAPQVRGQGIGQMLISSVAAWAQEKGRNRLELWVTEDNEPARRFYTQAGFVETGRTQPMAPFPELLAHQMVRLLPEE